MTKQKTKAVEALIVALPKSAGSAVYGLVDVSPQPAHSGDKSLATKRAAN